MKNFTFVQNQYESIVHFTQCMFEERPLFFGRIGGSDTNAIKHYYDKPDGFNIQSVYDRYNDVVRQYNGYFDFAENSTERKANFIRYMNDMIQFYRKMDDCSWTQLEGYLKDGNVGFLEDVLNGRVVVNYGSIQNMQLFLKSFSLWANKKKILFVSVFSESIKYQYQRKDRLYKDLSFPDFELVTYKTPLTYNSKDDTRESLKLVTNNWHEEWRRMAFEIGKLDFDIALLSCGSYGMPLGIHIRDVLKKKAVYLGGIVNLMWNIYGGRFSTYSALHGVDLAYEIDPLENSEVENIKGGWGVPGDGLFAYFGRREKK